MILRAGFESALDEVNKKLIDKAGYLKSLEKQTPTEKIARFIDKETVFIETMMAFIMAAKNLSEGLSQKVDLANHESNLNHKEAVRWKKNYLQEMENQLAFVKIMMNR